MTQPPLSRQLKELEDELGKQLFIHGNRRITLTEEGIILRKRAEEMVALMERTKAEISSSGENIHGEIYIEPADIKKYDFIKLLTKDRWGLLMLRDHLLAKKTRINPDDLQGFPLIASRQSIAHNELSGRLGKQYDSLHIVTTYNLLHNASLMVEENVGCALCLDHIVPEYKNSPLCFRPLEPQIEAGLDIV